MSWVGDKLFWSENNDRIGRVGIFVEEKLWKKVVEVVKKIDRVMALVLLFKKKLFE